ncbi:DL-endopeptidase inhibitor IseA family protein [Fredinandcohnia humi]
MKIKKVMIAGLAVALLSSTAVNMEVVSAKEVKVTQKVNKKTKFKELSTKEAVEIATSLAKITSYVQSGGTYKVGDYKTFTYNGKTYRYLAKDLDTRNELFTYLKRALTLEAANQFVKDQGIIRHKGKLAQLEADGGSLLQWQKATAEFVKEDKKTKTKYYRLTVPVGDTTEKQVFIVEYQYVEKSGWKISKKPYWDLDVPFNVNPVFLFFNNLVNNPENAKKQFIEGSTFPFDEFRKGIKKVEIRELREVGRSATQVEFVAKVDMQLESNYKGSLQNGINQFYFLVQPVGEYEFKIVSYGTAPHFVGK